MVRIVHLSDPHLGKPVFHWRNLTPRRVLGMVNFLVRRKYLFLPANLSSAVQEVVRLRPDVVVVSGDFSTVGLAGEFDLALEILRPAFEVAAKVLLVPGNHDRYGSDGEDSFRQVFSRWLPARFPQFVEIDGIPVVVLDAAYPYRLIPGECRCPDEQLDGLDGLILQPGLRTRPWVLVSHYPVCGEDGRPDYIGHRLSNASELACRLRAHPPALYLHGHIHKPWMVRTPLLPGTLMVNSGSASLRPAPSLAVHDIDPDGRGRSTIRRMRKDGTWAEWACEEFDFVCGIL